MVLTRRIVALPVTITLCLDHDFLVHVVYTHVIFLSLLFLVYVLLKRAVISKGIKAQYKYNQLKTKPITGKTELSRFSSLLNKAKNLKKKKNRRCIYIQYVLHMNHWKGSLGESVGIFFFCVANKAV